jgi:hypothetical protein
MAHCYRAINQGVDNYDDFLYTNIIYLSIALQSLCGTLAAFSVS